MRAFERSEQGRTNNLSSRVRTPQAAALRLGHTRIIAPFDGVVGERLESTKLGIAEICYQVGTRMRRHSAGFSTASSDCRLVNIGAKAGRHRLKRRTWRACNRPAGGKPIAVIHAFHQILDVTC
jgi:hypothetical protein